MNEIGWRLFIQGVIGELAWPASAVALGLMFRGELAKLLSRLTGLKLSGAEIGFSELVDQASFKASKIPLSGAGHEEPIRAEQAVLHPRLAIIMAWHRIERLSLELLSLVQPSDNKATYVDFSGTIAKKLALGDDINALLRDLRRMRNAAVHQHDDITEGQATEFLTMAARVERALSERIQAQEGNS